MKKRVWGLLLVFAVLVTTVNFPAVAGAEENDTSGVVIKVSGDVNGSNANESDKIQTVQISAQNQSQKDSVLRISLLNEDKETADTDVEIPNLCEKDQITDETVQTELDETLKSALTLADGTNTSLDAEWVAEKDSSGNVTARYLEASLPAGAATAFDMKLMYRTDEENYTKKTIVQAKAFVEDQDVTQASDQEDEDNETEVVWEMVQSDDASEAAEESEDAAKESEEVTDTAAASAESTKKSAASAQSVETYVGQERASEFPLQIADGISADSYITMPVTYYDYYDDKEVNDGWKNHQNYGNTGTADGWKPYGTLNGYLAQYYRDNQIASPIYFGNLYSGGNSAMAGGVGNHINWLKGIYSLYPPAANNSNDLGGFNKSATGIVFNELSSDGNLQIKEGVNAPYFDETWLTSTQSGTWTNPSYDRIPGTVLDSEFPFRVTSENGVNYYEYDSAGGKDNITLAQGNSGFVYSQGAQNGIRDASGLFGSADTDLYGFFPFNQQSDSQTNQIDYGFGAKFEIPFNLNKGGTSQSSTGQPVDTVFQFTGDDDVWVFVDNKLVLDLGGAHKMATGSINFRTGQVTNSGAVSVNGDNSYNQVGLFEALGVESAQDYDPTVKHTLTIFYMERGMIESNLKIRFNMQPITHEFIAEKQVNTAEVNEGLQDTVASADEFNIDLNVNGQPASGKTYQKNDGSTGETTGGYTTDENGGFTLRDRDQAVFKKQFDENIGDTFTAQESTVEDGKSSLTYDTEWNVTDLESGKVFDQGQGVNAEFKYNKQSGDLFTPVRNKLTYVNTPQIGSLSVEKKTVDNNGDPYEDPSTDFRFQIVLDMGIKTEGQEVSEVVSDPDSIYVRKPDNWSNIYAYCWNSTTNENNGSYPGVQLTDADRVEGFANTYKLENVRDKYDRVVFSIGNDSNKTGDLTITSSSSDPNMNYNYYSEAGGWDNKSQFLEYDTHYEPGEEIGFRGYRLAYKINGSGDTLYTDEGGYFTLKSGEKAVFEGIPAGTKFKIQEVSADGYTIKDVTINGSQPVKDTEGDYTGYYNGDIVSQTETKVLVTNEKAEVALSLKAHKTVDGGEKTPSAGEFRFVMSGMESTTLDDGTKTEDTTDYRSEVSNDVNGVAEFSTISYQKEGTYLYTIKEVTKTDAKYQYDKSEYEVKVVVEAEGGEMTRAVTVTKVKDRNGQELTPPEVVDDVVTGITFNNVTNTANMTVQKQLVKENGDPLERTSWPNQSTNFAFTFRLERWNENTGQYVPCGNQTYYFNNQQRTTQADGTFYLQPQDSASGAKAEFRGLIIGTKYRITEVLTNMSEYEFKNATVNGKDAAVTTTAREYAVETSIQKDENAVVFKNYPLSTITIVKQDENGNPLEGAEFTLEKWNADSQGWQAYGETVTSGSDGKAYFQNLHAGKYRITEIKTKAGYVLLKEPIEITLPYEYKAGSIVNRTKVTSGGTAYNITFTIVNGQAFDLPASGLSGIGPIAAAGIAIVVIAGAVFAARNIKGQRAASNRRKRRLH